jgi:hypothetical protein
MHKQAKHQDKGSRTGSTSAMKGWTARAHLFGEEEAVQPQRAVGDALAVAVGQGRNDLPEEVAPGGLRRRVLGRAGSESLMAGSAAQQHKSRWSMRGGKGRESAGQAGTITFEHLT